MAMIPGPGRASAVGGGRPDPRGDQASSSFRVAFTARDAPTVDPDAPRSPVEAVLAEFTARWEQSPAYRVETFLEEAGPLDDELRVELIYREYLLAESYGPAPSRDDYLERFPQHRAGLASLFDVHDLLTSSRLRLYHGPGEEDLAALPETGNTIGPYRLLRELGRGGFGRVFLAEQADLEDRLVVVKVSSRITPEPQLLARAGHPNIVELLSHGMVEDGPIQVICMPFLGGATLTSVLAERRRRGGRPATGGDLLDDLARASAPEYPDPGAARPSRELLAHLSYPRALAWIVARLAEALDFAYSRGVLHGDVKPSNVLFTAAAVPMLLDFNLSVGWQPLAPKASDLPADAGGTFAYMAPERLLQFAGPGPGPGPSARPTAADRHRADVYSLGVVFLELLTGRPPELRADGGGGVTLEALASAYFTSRLQGARVMIRSARRPVPAGLRAVLERCLAVDPADRYRRASDLAEDLDRWRNGLPLAHAREPALSAGLARWGRGRRKALVAGLGIALTLAATVLAVRLSDASHRGTAVLFHQIASTWDSGAFSIRRAWSRDVKGPGDRAEIARRQLRRFGVLDPGDWRQRDEFRSLPRFERDELELWLMEQALRFARALGARPDSPEDWRRGLFVLDRTGGTWTSGALEAERRLLLDRLGSAAPAGPHAPPSDRPLPEWMEDYLAGVRAELHQSNHDDPARDALAHYRNVLRTRPLSFWANYRAAAAHFALHDYAAAAACLERCLERCPDSAVLRTQYAGCLWARSSDGRAAPVDLGKRARELEEAATQYDRAQSLDPDFAETYLSRAILRMGLGQADGLVRDLDRYDLLSGLGTSTGPDLVGGLDLTTDSRTTRRPATDAPAERAALDPDEARLRCRFAAELERLGRSDAALGQIDLALTIDPDLLTARYLRAVLRSRNGAEGAYEDCLEVTRLPDSRFEPKANRQAIPAFSYVSARLIGEGRLDEAVDVARRGVRLGRRHRLESRLQGQLHYGLALALLHTAMEDPSVIEDAKSELREAFRLAPAFVKERCAADGAFVAIRKTFGQLPTDQPD